MVPPVGRGLHPLPVENPHPQRFLDLPQAPMIFNVAKKTPMEFAAHFGENALARCPGAFGRFGRIRFPQGV